MIFKRIHLNIYFCIYLCSRHLGSSEALMPQIKKSLFSCSYHANLKICRLSNRLYPVTKPTWHKSHYYLATFVTDFVHCETACCCCPENWMHLSLSFLGVENESCLGWTSPAVQVIFQVVTLPSFFIMEVVVAVLRARILLFWVSLCVTPPKPEI